MAVLKTFQPSIFSALQYDRVTLNKSKVLLRHRDIHFLLADKALNDIDPNQVKQFIEPLITTHLHKCSVILMQV